MSKIRVYLDNCSFNRPYDNLEVIKIKLEAEAKMFIQHQIFLGNFELAWSYMMDYENSLNPYEERKEAIARWKIMSVVDIDESPQILQSAKEIARKGIKNKDAIHIASAIEAQSQYFITTDGGLLNKSFEQINIINPLDFIKQYGK